MYPAHTAAKREALRRWADHIERLAVPVELAAVA
jgi:hypothetical protein